MARGKQTCKILKEIRRQIAEVNDIEFVTSECRFKGDCLGTCPKCEAEVRYLEQQLRARYMSGKAIALAGISTGMMLMSGCSGTSVQQSNETSALEPNDTIEQCEETDTMAEEVKEQEIPDDLIRTVGEINFDLESQEKSNEDVINNAYINPDKNYIYESAEVLPEFPGGDKELQRFIREHLKYPEEELKEGIQGRLIVRFIVDTLGRVSKPRIVRSKGPAFDNEALRVVSLLPAFTPGKINGQIVNSYYTVPVIFKLPAD